MSKNSMGQRSQLRMLRDRLRLRTTPGYWQIISTTAVSILTASILSLFLAGTEAVAEGLVVSGEGSPVLPTAMLLSSLLYALTSWFFTRLIIVLVWPQWTRGSRLVRFSCRYLPRMVAASPLLALSFGLVSNGLSGFAALLCVFSVVILILPHRTILQWTNLVALSCESSRHPARRLLARWSRLPILPKIHAVALSVLGMLAFLLFTPSRVNWTTMLGPAALLLVWGAALIAALSPFVYLSRMFRFPIFSLAMLAALLFSSLDINDDHNVRLIHLKPNSVASPQLNFFGWLKSRPDFTAYEEYPVILVSTEGGGLRAG